MSEYSAISDISNTIVSLLRTHTAGLITPGNIVIGSPADITEDTSPSLSLFLYHIGENPHLKNLEMQPGDGGTLKYPGLPLTLFYLLTPYASSRDTEQQIIGRAMQILFDNAIIRGSLLQGSLAGSGEEIIVTFNPLSVDDMNKLWSLFGSKPYRTSITYRVSTALIDSTREEAVDRVIRQEMRFSVT